MPYQEAPEQTGRWACLKNVFNLLQLTNRETADLLEAKCITKVSAKYNTYVQLSQYNSP